MNRRGLLIACLLIAGCAAPPPATGEALSPLGGGGGAAGAGGGAATCCAALIEPEPAHSPVAVPYTGIPVIPCTDNTPCAAAADCRRYNCNTDCGFCMFLNPATCQVDGCPGHNNTCASDAECSPSSHYNTECSAGRCIVLPPAGSGYDCAGPGEPYNEGP